MQRFTRWTLAAALLLTGSYFTISIAMGQMGRTPRALSPVSFVKMVRVFLPQNVPLTAGSVNQEIMHMLALSDDPVTTQTGLQYQDTVIGEGKGAQRGDLVMLHYTSYLPDGTLFESSVPVNEPLFFSLGEGTIDEGLIGMKKGGQRTLLIPSQLAVDGQASAPSLLYTVQLLAVDVSRTPAPVSDYVTSDSGLQFAVLEEGEGIEAKPGDQVLLHYSAWLEDATVFNTSRLTDSPVAFILGEGSVIAGWDEGIIGMKVGETRQLYIPAHLAHGAPPIPPTISPTSALIFEIQLLEIDSNSRMAQANRSAS
ncbi:MAG: FKBP-type peptidyl-prolyl cis-trans isomerase [Ardenticatenaceae bacterium]